MPNRLHALIGDIRKSLQDLSRTFHTSLENLYPKLSSATLHNLEWKMDKLPYWILISERYAVKRELFVRSVASAARKYDAPICPGGDA